MKYRLIIGLLAVVVQTMLVAPGLAQEPSGGDSTKVAQSPVMLNRADDTSVTTPMLLQPAKPDTGFWSRPTGALFKSVLVPGWGQLANGKYQKAAIYAGLETYFALRAAHFFRKTREHFDRFRETDERSDYFAYDNAKNNRNKFYWYLAGTIFISMWDAYTDAHLKPFEETEGDDDYWGLSDRPEISPPGVSLALTFKY